MNSTRQTAPVESFLSGKLTQVDVAGIERELRRLWAQASEGEGADGYPNVVRACSFNLILFTGEEDAEVRGGDILDEIVVHHPSRAILAIYRPDKPLRLEAWVSARCHLTGSAGMKQICSEQITVLSEGQGPNELPSVVTPLLIPDLPVFLWWRSAKLNRPLLEKLLSSSRRLILDSAREPFNLQFLFQAAELTVPERECLFASDLNWRRLRSWCQSLGNAFDGFPLRADYLFQWQSLTIWHSQTSAVGGQISCQSLLLVSWLASRLSWEPVAFERDGNQDALARFEFNGRDLTVRFASRADSLPPGSVLGLECTFADGQHLNVSYQLRENIQYIAASTDSPSGRAEELEPVTLDLSEARLIGQEVEVIGRDKVYEGAMEMAGRLMQLLGTEK